MPDPWLRLLQRTSPAPLLWTYAELGGDLQTPGQTPGSKERSEFLRALIGRLSLPKGSSAFWPITLAEEWDDCLAAGKPAPDAVHFRQGMTQLAPKALVIFGAHSCQLSGIGLNLSVPFTQSLSHGRLYLLLPAFDELVHSDALKERAAAYLRSACTNFPALFLK